MAIRPAHLLLPALAALTGCGGGPGNDRAQIEASEAWARATAPGQDTGGIFLDIRNRGDAEDRLVGASTPAAQSVQFHDMTMDGGVMRMRRKDAVNIPSRGSVELAPGGTHLMLVGLKAPLKAGTTIAVSLQFDKAGRTDVTVKVRPIGATGPRDDRDE